MSKNDIAILYSQNKGAGIMHKIILSFVSVMKVWLIASIIIFPIILSFCKAAKRGDSKNAFINQSKDNKA
jgi:hypothetical protein